MWGGHKDKSRGNAYLETLQIFDYVCSPFEGFLSNKKDP